MKMSILTNFCLLVLLSGIAAGRYYRGEIRGFMLQGEAFS